MCGKCRYLELAEATTCLTNTGKQGYDVKTLGWGTVEQQRYRFFQTLNMGVDFIDRDILDVGCGFGDFADFLLDQDVSFSSYAGIDINPDLIQEATKRHSLISNVDFVLFDILSDDLRMSPQGDIGIMLGVLNLNLQEEIDNYDYTKKIMKHAFSLVRECLIVDFISIYREETYPKEDFIFYHDPSIMLKFGFELSSNVVLRHDYAAIPQKEFMMALYKE